MILSLYIFARATKWKWQQYERIFILCGLFSLRLNSYDFYIDGSREQAYTLANLQERSPRMTMFRMEAEMMMVGAEMRYGYYSAYGHPEGRA